MKASDILGTFEDMTEEELRQVHINTTEQDDFELDKMLWALHNSRIMSWFVFTKELCEEHGITEEKVERSLEYVKDNEDK